MEKTQLHNRQKKIHISPKRLLGALLSLIVFFILLTSVIGLAEKHFAMRSRIKELHAQERELKEKQKDLTQMNSELETLEGKEFALRTKYNVVKPGEEMIVVTQEKEIEYKDTRPRMRRWWDSIIEGLGLKSDS
jgi:cell division protein FtsB